MVKVPVYLSKSGNPYSDKTFHYTPRTAEIKDDKGNVVETIPGTIFPDFWSDSAVNTVATKYFRRAGVPGTGREVDIRQLAGRVAKSVAQWGREEEYFDDKNARNAEKEVVACVVGQYGAFNSPVWFNVGLNYYGIRHSEDSYRFDTKRNKVVKVRNYYDHPQGSACFIAHPKDSVEDMMRVAAIFSARLFKGGSGIGSSWYRVRSAGEPISGGGQASGAQRFMDVQDSVARVIKSGGKTRRAAVFQNLPIWHPDMFEIVRNKFQEDRKARALIEAGSPSDWESHTIQNLRGQNVNVSILSDDEFWKAYEADTTYKIRRVVDGKVVREERARAMLEQIAFATHGCGDPGMQYFDNMNKWNTCLNDGQIWGSNPCSEFLFLDNTACNLASTNLMRFRKPNGAFDLEKFWKVNDLLLTSQDIFVDSLSYPSEEIALNSHLYRPLGLGYANVGAYIMSLGFPYDSDEARSFAAAITSAMNAGAWLQSARLAEQKGPFERFTANREHVLRVLDMHRKAAKQIVLKNGLEGLVDHSATIRKYDEAYARVEEVGARNAQVTLLAPTGTIGFMMDCDTTGVEPDIALKKYKTLAGGGYIRIINRTVPTALERLGYDEAQKRDIVQHIEKTETIEGAPHLKEEHLPVFDCAVQSGNSSRVISPRGHIRMLGAVQPHVSGAISKTINCPESTTVDEIRDMFYDSWRMGLKAVAIYRDGSKAAQPVTTKKYDNIHVLKRGEREHLPHCRTGVIEKVKIGDIPLFLRSGEWPDGRLGELWIDSMERGTDLNLALNGLAIEFSEKIQAGMKLEEAIEVFDRLGKSQVSGITDHPFIRMTKGFGQFIYNWSRAHYLGDISFLFDDEGKPTQPEMRPLPWELRTYQLVPRLHLIPTVAGKKFYEGAPSLEETIKKKSPTNFWCDSFEGLDTRRTIEKIEATRQWGKDGGSIKKLSKRLTGKMCDKCGAIMESDGVCSRCPICMKGGGCGGG